MRYEEFKKTGVFENGIVVSDLIESLKEYKEFYGDQRIKFVLHGEEHEQPFIQFEYFRNGINIYVEEEDPR